MKRGKEMKENFKFYHNRTKNVIYSAYKLNFEGEDFYLIIWHNRLTTTYNIREVEMLLGSGEWVKA
jgi:hypothetical protein